MFVQNMPVIKNKKSLLSALSNPKYRGRHLVIIKGKIFSAQTGQAATKIFKEIVKKYPKEKPTITYIPKDGSLILLLMEHGNSISF